MFVYSVFDSEAAAELAHTTLLDHSFPDEDVQGYWAERIDFSANHMAGGLVIVGVDAPTSREQEARAALVASGARRVYRAQSVVALNPSEAVTPARRAS